MRKALKRHKLTNVVQFLVTGWVVYNMVLNAQAGDWSRFNWGIVAVAALTVFFWWARHAQEMMGYGREEQE